ncbi:maltose permease [Aspergillus steynii IBT 23096]|uniref:Maltose permease n=1 Tax=Aspergillus steynii IBT 23096 TaxID=1392250 RepID=A0A2I2G0R2_9EURO|nr:maltose permease [Aspergillus steynii IBT 23096]PLB46475.1 maltose permease [Aspergillus steynii IBT 23096]
MSFEDSAKNTYDHHEGDQEIGTASPRKRTSGMAELLAERRILGWCLLIFILPINFGYEIALVGNILAIPSFLERFGQDTPNGREIPSQTQQILNSATYGGIFLAAFTAGFVSDIFGRRKVVITACLICIAGIFVQAFAKTILVIFGGKLISTMGFGLGHSLAPVFVAEISPDSIRGISLILINTMIVLGQWSCALVGYGGSFISNDWGWRMPILTQLVPPVSMFILGSLLLPESPSWLLMKGRHEEAVQSLRKFRGPEADVETAIAQMEVAIEKEKQVQEQGSSYIECFQGTNRRRTIIVLMVYVSQQLIGSNFITSYLPYFFTIAGVHDAVAVAQGAYAIQLVGNIMSWFLVERLGRRPLITYGAMILTALLAVIGGIGTLPTSNKSAQTGIVALMAIWGFGYQLTIGAVAFAIGGETPTLRLRQKTYSLNVMANTAFGTLTGMVLPILINPGQANLGGKVAFIFFAPSVFFCVYFFFCLPEMKGRSYLELEELFQRKVPARKFKEYPTEELIPEDINEMKPTKE